MIVGVNMISLAPGEGGGEEIYLRSVLKRIRVLQPDTHLLLFTDTTNHASFSDWECQCLGDEPKALAALDKAVKRAGIQVLFTPLAAAPPKCSAPIVPFVLSLYGITPKEKKSGWFGRGDRGVLHTLTDAPCIFASSEFIRRELLENFEAPMNKVVVGHLGVSEVFGEPQGCFVEKPFLLTVGVTRHVKNVRRLLEAFDRLKEEYPHNLVVVGRAGDAEPDDWGERVIRIDSVPANHLAGLYQHCDAFLHIPLYDGTGVTMLEAMRAGSPIIASRVGAIHEVAGAVPIYINAESVPSILGAVRRVIGETGEERIQRINFGRKVASEFTWDKCAWKTLQAIGRG